MSKVVGLLCREGFRILLTTAPGSMTDNRPEQYKSTVNTLHSMVFELGDSPEHKKTTWPDPDRKTQTRHRSPYRECRLKSGVYERTIIPICVSR